ncbi:MAG: Asp-tRNA(Asn)/Glu-tRNA(Gln) amidotransferase subunit GatC [Proteobacteria bacterium]|nr:Asp-tRNA(Asn)/Glu-tRNA(Gln) amidotransferase subunit GatC [Pseudomonadota bacterium]
MSDIDLSHLAKLSKLALTEQEKSTAKADLERIIHMVDQMQAMDTSGVEPLAHPLETTQRLRGDEVTEQGDRARFQQGAPATENGLYLVPRVVE